MRGETIRDERGRGSGRMWGGAMLLFAAALLVWELSGRMAGLRPSVIDDPDLWAQERARIHPEDAERVVVILGTSRILLDVDLAVLRDALPDHRPVQLAVSGRFPLAALRDLARDPDFAGLVVVDLVERAVLPADRWAQQAYVDHYHREWGLPAAIDRAFATWVQERLVSVQPEADPLRYLTRALEGRDPPAPPYTITAADRSVSADYLRTDVAEVRRRRVEAARRFYEVAPRPTPEEWLRLARVTAPWVRAIREREGAVVFVRPPTTGATWEMDEEAFPRADYWDRFAAETPAETIHFRDVPGMRDLACPDTSHLDARDAPEFTRALVRALRERGLVEP